MNARSVFTYAEASVCAILLSNAVHRKTGKKYSAKPSSLFSSSSFPLLLAQPTQSTPWLARWLVYAAGTVELCTYIQTALSRMDEHLSCGDADSSGWPLPCAVGLATCSPSIHTLWRMLTPRQSPFTHHLRLRWGCGVNLASRLLLSLPVDLIALPRGREV